jgi:prepilin-type N-terminal cleavage/methylation domain-containing protein
MRWTDDRGVTMVELMVAMILLVIALLALAASFPYSMQGVAAGGYQTAATLLAQQSIDQARGKPYDRLCAMDTSGTFVTVPEPGFSAFARQISVSPLAAPCPGTPTGSTTTTVTVTVRFQGIGGMGSGSVIWDTTLATIRAQ